MRQKILFLSKKVFPSQENVNYDYVIATTITD